MAEVVDKPITLKLAVDKTQNRVVFAEAEADFVDILLSFLTMPMGTIVRLCGKDSSIGCMYNLYKSVESLDVKYFNTEPCKTMLLCPRNASEDLCKYLKINLDETKDPMYFLCNKQYCDRFVLFPGLRCSCGGMYDLPRTFPSTVVDNVREEAVFVNGMHRFMISDDLTMNHASTGFALLLVDKLGVLEDRIEEKKLQISPTEILKLLQQAFFSTTLLTDVLLENRKSKSTALRSSDTIHQHNAERRTNPALRKMTIKLIVDKAKSKVLYAEAEQDFVDLLFSFLTFPVGLMQKNLGGQPHGVGCIHGLYSSVENMSKLGCLKNDICKQKLLNPKLPKYYSCSNKPIEVEEEESANITVCSNWSCLYRKSKYGKSCSCIGSCISSVDPKKMGTTPTCGGFMKVGTYMVTDELVITPLSSLSGLSQLRKAHLSFSSVEEKTVGAGTDEALKLMKACLTSKTVLTDTFLVASKTAAVKTEK